MNTWALLIQIILSLFKKILNFSFLEFFFAQLIGIVVYSLLSAL